MKKVSMSAIFVMAVIMCSSCASIISGKQQKISMTTLPEGAKIYVDGKDMGVVTPAEVKVPRQAGKRTVMFTKDGFKNGSVELPAKFNPFTYLNILLLPGAPIGFVVDMLGTKAALKYDEEVTYDFNVHANDK